LGDGELEYVREKEGRQILLENQAIFNASKAESSFQRKKSAVEKRAD
jgi:hypothetical protein